LFCVRSYVLISKVLVILLSFVVPTDFLGVEVGSWFDCWPHSIISTDDAALSREINQTESVDGDSHS
jgi:hypothetical protein